MDVCLRVSFCLCSRSAVSLILLALLGALTPHSSVGQLQIQCYDSQGRAQRCMPQFGNAAFGKRVISNNTCGDPPKKFCVQTGVLEVRKECEMCNASDPALEHPALKITDIKDDTNRTWWQSETLLENPDKPVTLTLDLGKSYDVSYIRIRFRSPRPESMAIYKKTTPSSKWIPYQYFSATCEKTYGVTTNGIVDPRNQQVALCTDAFSTITPLTGGNVAFSTLEDRPDAYNFDNSPALQEWVTAVAVRIHLRRMNTFGDEVFGDPNVLRSYYYAIIDLSIGGRCKCNGHASECEETRLWDGQTRLQCKCQHDTEGVDCERCKPLYNDRPWARASSRNANECVRCNCNGLAESCVFDEALYRQTGHGGRCQNCKQNTDGPNCERCKENFYRKTSLEPCVACGCNPVGSVSLQCNSEGQCRCKPGVTGIKCDKCQANYFGFSQTGCRPCQCFGPGTDPAKTQCNEKGECTCKRHVVGAKCTLCRSGYFGLEASNPHGCKQCFCYGHSTVCKAAPGYTSRNITTDFTTGLEGWAVENDQGKDVTEQYAAHSSAGFVSVTAIGKESLFARASLVYIGNRRSSYGQTFGFMFRVGTVDGMQVDNGDITIEGEGGLKITTQLTAQGNPKPGVAFQQYRYRLHEDASFGWRPSLTSHDFQRLLTSIKSIKIRMNYADQGTGMLDGMFFESAVYDPTSPNQVNWVEQCSCPKEYKGNNCEQCKDGYTRQAGSTDRYAQCVPCQCYGHSDTCDPVTGKCNCKHNTTGIRCDKCIDGYYGNPTQGTPDDCKKCPCKFGTRCIQIGANVVCTDCPEGHVGNLCDMCQDGYYGDPMGKRGAPTTCQKCNCSGNIDPNAIGSCDRLTGDCLKCIHNTRNGPISQCELCAIGYYGNATHYPKPQCKACECYVQGTVSPPGHDPTLPFPCDDKGRCTCLPNVSGDKCDTCRPEYWNVASGKGCEPCNCDTTGSWNNTCSVTTGQCHCKPGVTGRRCDQCSIDHYAFSELGCLACNCNLQGSLNVTCDEQGVCQCRPGVLGIKCDSCQENFHNLTAGCIACPPCYDVIQKIVGGLRRKLYDLIYIIDRFNTSSSVVVDVDFEKRLALLKEQVERLLAKAEEANSTDKVLQEEIMKLNDRVTATRNKVIEIWKNTQAAGNASRAGMSDAMMAHDSLNVSRHLLDLMKSLLMSDAARSLNESRLFANSTGEWRMREIAEETKKLADKHENQADEITQKAVQAANASEQAVKTVDKAVEAQNQTSIDLAELRRMLGEVEQLHVTTRANASKARDRAQNAMRDADELYKNGTAPLPDLGIDAIRAKANETKAKASEKAMEAMKILSDLKGLVTSFDAKEADVRKKMAEWPGLMDQLEKLLAAIDNANATAWDAFIKGEDTLQKAKEMLETMQKFNEIIENSRKEAEKAEQNIPEIERLIASANAKSDNATASLGDAQQVAGEAKDKAGQAQKTADAARMKAEKIRIEAQNLTLPTDTVSTPAKRAADKLQELKDRVGRERDAIAAAKEKSTNATAASKRARDKIDEVLRKLNELLKEIDNLDMVDMNKLDELEKKLDNEIESERKVDGALANVEDTHRIIRERITEYTVDLERLKKQMAQVQNVINSMPDTCKKRITKSEGRG